MIALDNVSFAFDKRVILERLTLKLVEKRIAIIGANGCGKSTFLRLLNGLLLPTSGHVTIGGLDTKQDGRMVRRKVGFVFQNPDNQIVMPVVEEDLAFGLKNLKLEKAEISERIDAILSRYGLEALRNRPTHLLSGGEKQMLAICGTLIMQPDIVLFDEPTTQLDLRNKYRITNMIDKLDQQVIIISHDLDMLKNFERVLVFDQGRVAFDGVSKEAVTFYRDMMDHDDG